MKIVAAVIGWLLSPAAVEQREKKRAEDQTQKGRQDIANGDADAVSARIDKLRNQYRLSEGDKRSRQD